jgi:predicted Zn-dependent protease with MMP-like domain
LGSSVTAATLLDEALAAADAGDLARALDLAVEGTRVAGRGDDPDLKARLALAEARALVGLGDARAALERLAEADRLSPGDLDVWSEEANALYELCRFEDAAVVLENVLREDPEDAWAHHLLGLVSERLHRPAAAARHLARARAVAPEDFPEPVSLSPDAFEAVVEEALDELPEPVRKYLANVAIAVEDLPELHELVASDPPHSPSILGIFRGSPFPQKGTMDPWSHFPSSIGLFQRNLERYARDREELVEEIRVTLLHEVGHFLGLDEEELERLGLD